MGLRVFVLSLLLVGRFGGAEEHAEGRTRVERVRGGVPGLPTIVYVAPCPRDAAIGQSYQCHIRSGLEACGYPNLVTLLDTKGPEETVAKLRDPGVVPPLRNNYLVVFDAHGFAGDDGYEVEWGKLRSKGDELVRGVEASFPKQKLNLWLDTCHAGACTAIPGASGLGCACGPRQQAIAVGGPLTFFVRAACLAARGDCRYHAKFDADRDGRLEGAELKAALKSFLTYTPKRGDVCSVSIPVGTAGAAAELERRLAACAREKETPCRAEDGTLSLEPERAIGLSLRLAASGVFEGKRGDTEVRIPFEALPVRHRVPLFVEPGPVRDAAVTRAVTSVAAMPETLMQKARPPAVGEDVRQALGKESRYQMSALTLSRVVVQDAEVTATARTTCRYTGGVMATSTGIQIPELRNFALDFPRCAGPSVNRPPRR